MSEASDLAAALLAGTLGIAEHGEACAVDTRWRYGRIDEEGAWVPRRRIEDRGVRWTVVDEAADLYERHWGELARLDVFRPDRPPQIDFFGGPQDPTPDRGDTLREDLTRAMERVNALIADNGSEIVVRAADAERDEEPRPGQYIQFALDRDGNLELHTWTTPDRGLPPVVYRQVNRLDEDGGPYWERVVR